MDGWRQSAARCQRASITTSGVEHVPERRAPFAEVGLVRHEAVECSRLGEMPQRTLIETRATHEVLDRGERSARKSRLEDFFCFGSKTAHGADAEPDRRVEPHFEARVPL